MGRMMLGIDNTIIFKEDTHQYFDRDANEYQSVTRILKKIQVPFDKDKVSGFMAVTIAKEKGISVEQAKTELLLEWEGKRDSSIDRGTGIHKHIEYYLNTGNKVMELAGVINYLNEIIKPAYRYYSEIILYDQTTKIAGQTDLVIQRQKTPDSVYDFYDYKTNESKGIQFDSIGRKSDVDKHYNKYFLSPLEHMEDCNYSLYSLQLSLYAYLAQVTYGIKIGRLGIIFIDNEMKVQMFPVPYLKMEAVSLVFHMSRLHQLPTMVAQKIEPTIKVEEDW